jgi:hypothetical protein
MEKAKRILGKVFDFLLKERTFRFLCFLLIGMSLILAIATGFKGEYKAMHNHLNWALWILIVILYSHRIEYQEMRSKAYLEFIGKMEEYRESSESYIQTLREKSDLQDQVIKSLESDIEKMKKDI